MKWKELPNEFEHALDHASENIKDAIDHANRFLRDGLAHNLSPDKFIAKYQAETGDARMPAMLVSLDAAIQWTEDDHRHGSRLDEYYTEAVNVLAKN